LKKDGARFPSYKIISSKLIKFLLIIKPHGPRALTGR